MRRLFCLLLLLPAACVDAPELDQAVPDWVQNAAYPDLIPLDGLGTATPPAREAEKLRRQLTARQAWLKRKASALQAPVIDPETRARLTAANR